MSNEFVEIFGVRFNVEEDELIIDETNLPRKRYPDLSDVKGLKQITHIESLTLELGGITKIEHLQDFSQLHMLNLSRNIIQKIERLERLKNLGFLNLEYNSISKLEGLNSLNALIHLESSRI